MRSLFLGMIQHHSVRAASAMAFSLFLATIPMLALAGWTFAYVLETDPRAVGGMTTLLDLAPGQVQQLLVGENVQRFRGAVAPFVLLGSLWLASGAFETVMTVFETALETRRRPWWHKRLIALACVLVGFAAAALSGVVVVVIAGGPVALIATLAGGEAQLAKTTTFLIAVVTTTLLVAAFFRIAVDRPGARRRVWPGALITVLIGAIASWGFAHFATRLARYTAYYGSLAAVAVLLLWLWICCAALLLGAEINAQLEGVERHPLPRDPRMAPPPAPTKPDALIARRRKRLSTNPEA